METSAKMGRREGQLDGGNMSSVLGEFQLDIQVKSSWQVDKVRARPE